VVTKVTDLLGSPAYMAPEQIVSARDADAGSDVWSLGVILFRLITGKPPFVGTSLGELIQAIMHAPIPSLRDVKPDVPQGLERVVSRCLDRDRNRRLKDAVELARLLAHYAGPVATPSLERIAVLGPALSVSVPPSANTPTADNGRNAWTRPPVNRGPPRREERGEFTAKTAALWAGVFVLFVTVTAIMVAKIAGASRERLAHPLPRAPSAALATAPATAISAAATVLGGEPGATGAAVRNAGATAIDSKGARASSSSSSLPAPVTNGSAR
jgi:serine/threonine-protein kinase